MLFVKKIPVWPIIIKFLISKSWNINWSCCTEIMHGVDDLNRMNMVYYSHTCLPRNCQHINGLLSVLFMLNMWCCLFSQVFSYFIVLPSFKWMWAAILQSLRNKPYIHLTYVILCHYMHHTLGWWKYTHLGIRYRFNCLDY